MNETELPRPGWLSEPPIAMCEISFGRIFKRTARIELWIDWESRHYEWGWTWKR